MQLGRVCGQIVSTKKAGKLTGFKILVVQPISLETFEDKGAPFVSLDGVGAGNGEVVMCVAGSSSRQTAETDAKPVDNLIVAIIDSVDILGERVFDKFDPNVKPGSKDEKTETEEKKSEETPEQEPVKELLADSELPGEPQSMPETRDDADELVNELFADAAIEGEQPEAEEPGTEEPGTEEPVHTEAVEAVIKALFVETEEPRAQKMDGEKALSEGELELPVIKPKQRRRRASETVENETEGTDAVKADGNIEAEGYSPKH